MDDARALSAPQLDFLAGLLGEVRSDPMSFECGGRLLDERFSLLALRRAAAEELRGFQGTARRAWRNGIQWRRATGIIDTYSRFVAALTWASERMSDPNWLATMPSDEAQAVCLLTWLIHDPEADQLERLLCESQRLPFHQAQDSRGQPLPGRQLASEVYLDDARVDLARAALAKARGYRAGRAVTTPAEVLVERLDAMRADADALEREKARRRERKQEARHASEREKARMLRAMDRVRENVLRDARGAPSSPTEVPLEVPAVLELPPLTSKEEAALRLLLECQPHAPITSEMLATRLSSRRLPYTEAAGIRSRMIPKFKRLGLKSHGRRGYSFPPDARARVQKALDRDADARRILNRTPPRTGA